MPTLEHEIAQGRAHCGEDCTLNGKQAIIAGRKLDYGIVATLPDGARAEFAWPTIARVMAHGGNFKR